ncbi:hypothetical protein CRUP_016294, partial [Coryphaenoides rupestris]
MGTSELSSTLKSTLGSAYMPCIGMADLLSTNTVRGVRNYLKEALVSIITVHAEARLELCALRDAVSSYLTADS